MLDVLLPVILILVIFAALNTPLWISILVSTVYLQFVVNGTDLASTFTNLIQSLAKSSLLCIPFFVLAGGLMQTSSLGKRLIDLFVCMLKRVRGGFAIAALIANAFFGAISGSSPAAVATFGKIIYDPLEKNYDSKLSIGLLASSGALSVIIPPSISLIIYGTATNTSVSELFMAGLLPGCLIILIVGVYLIIKCKPAEVPIDVTGGITLGKAFLQSIPVIILPIIILGGIYGGVFTPTEAAAVAVIYATIVPLLLKDIKFRDLPKVVGDSCKTAGQIMVLIAVSCAFAQAATIAQIPQAITEVFQDSGQVQFLIILNIVLLLVGCFFEPGSAILILAPLVLPVATTLGVDPVHLGIIFTVNLAIGMFTPPFGLNLFVVQGVLGKNLGEISRAVVPFIVLYIIACLIITYVPAITLALPAMIM